NIALMLVGSIPVFALLMCLGGIHPYQIVGTMLVLATTALAAGSLGGLVALWRDKTFQALAMTVLFLVLYICLVQALALVPYFSESVDSSTIRAWQNTLDPFRALGEVLDPPLVTKSLHSDPIEDT